MAGGLEMQFTVAIDYTASNGDPNVAGSLHYHDTSGRSLNQVSWTVVTHVFSFLYYTYASVHSETHMLGPVFFPLSTSTSRCSISRVVSLVFVVDAVQS